MSEMDACVTMLFDIPVGTRRCVCSLFYTSGGGLRYPVKKNEG